MANSGTTFNLGYSMFPTNQDIAELVEWRRRLHRNPELSGFESETAYEVRTFLVAAGADRIVEDIGGHGVAGVFEGAEQGPTIMFRAELDALPIEELSGVPHSSTIAGRGHLCGHDGHMATLGALARGLGRKRPAKGRAVLMFQPAEENGAGAAAVIADPKFREIAPDFVFAYHNLPGVAQGRAALAKGPVNCASRGMRMVFSGKTAHAAMPETGKSPMTALSRLMPALTALGSGEATDPYFAMVTVTHATMGEAAFGIAPGRGELWATLRTLTDEAMDRLAATAEWLVREAALTTGLTVEIEYRDIFAHCENAPEAVEHLARALDGEGIAHDSSNLPMRASEDFGRFRAVAPAAMFFLGAGADHPSLHNPDYDFPDDLIATGSRVFMRTLRGLLG